MSSTPPPAAAPAPAPAPDDVTPRPTERPWLPVAAGAVTLVLWASAFVAIRHLGESVSPGALSLGRLLVAALVLGALLLLRRRSSLRWPVRRHLPVLLLCGVAWFGVYNVALNAAERRIDAGTAALVVQVGPILVALLATVFLGEVLHRWLVVGMVVGFAGVVVIAQASSGHGTGDLGGVLLALVAALTYAVGVLSQKPVLAHAGALEVTFLACAIGAAVCLPWAGDLVTMLGDSSVDTVVWIVYLGLFPTALAFSTWAYALSRTNASTMALTTFLVPFLAAGIAWVALDEVPPPLAFLGGALCIGGVLLTRRRPRPAAAGS
ncbi:MULTISPECIES: DMT family transporter [unclassified Nocardioides]|uniref:DMT family transporter n=1 Tax=unclassified Nocardioides TaxID=2615069 RepID=UPI0024063584|nr:MULTISPECIES: DMT family transporter [unclassified Nocardioides]